MSDADFDEADGEDTFGNLLSFEELVEEDLCALEENTQYNTRPPLQFGQRVKVNRASARYAGEHWIGLAEEKTTGWKPHKYLWDYSKGDGKWKAQENHLAWQVEGAAKPSGKCNGLVLMFCGSFTMWTNRRISMLAIVMSMTEASKSCIKLFISDCV